MGYLRLILVLAALAVSLSMSTALAAEPGGVVLPVPQRTQFDGTVWAGSNCGPSAIAMVLEAYGQKVPNRTLRDRANKLLGIADPDTGTRIQDLAQVVREHGLSVDGPYQGTSRKLRRWTLDEVRAEVKAGRPVVVQVFFSLLPNHRGTRLTYDHYVPIVGVTETGFVFNDSADAKAPGHRQPITTEELTRAWTAATPPFAGFSVGPGSDGRSLLLPPPTPTPAPDPVPTAAPAFPSPTPGIVQAAPAATPDPIVLAARPEQPGSTESEENLTPLQRLLSLLSAASKR